MFDKRDQVNLAWIGLGILFIGFLGAPLVHLLHVHGSLKSIHRALALNAKLSHTVSSLPLSESHVHSGAEAGHTHGHPSDSDSDEAPSHQHGGASLEHPDFLCAEAAAYLPVGLISPRVEVALLSPVERVHFARVRTPAMPQGP